MSILSGFDKIKRRIKTSSGYKLVSQWTSAQTVEMSDGKNLQEKISAMDNTINGKAPSSHEHSPTEITGLTPSKLLISNSSGNPSASNITANEASFLSGVTKNIQTQFNELNSNLNKLIPDYSQGVEIINGNVHDYPSLGDGWIQIRGRNGATSVDGALMRLFINGVLIDETSVSGRYKYYTSALYPIKEGDIIKVTDASYSETNQILFYPGRGI